MFVRGSRFFGVGVWYRGRKSVGIFFRVFFLRFSIMKFCGSWGEVLGFVIEFLEV